MTDGTRQAPLARADDLKRQYEAQRRAEKAGVFVLAARRALERGQLEQAKAQLKSAFEQNPGDEKAVDVLGDVYLAEGETQKALDLFEKALGRYPNNASFEERAAVCRLDLAEMEADKTLAPLLLETGDQGKVFERSPQKALSLSVFLPGAGQFYNEQNEKGAACLGAYFLSTLCWFYPLASQMKASTARDAMNIGLMISRLGGLDGLMFKIGALVSMGIYFYSLWDAWTSAAKWNLSRRKTIGLEP